MRLRCRKCMKINDFKGEGEVSNCASCGANMKIQFLSFAEIRRASFALGDKNE